MAIHIIFQDLSVLG